MFLSCVAFGPNQLAHAAGRGARDALALMVLTWLEGFEKSLKFAIYCSDVSGAFDKVRRAKGIHPSVIRVLSSLRAAKDCQEELHSWGRSNQIQFMHVVEGCAGTRFQNPRGRFRLRIIDGRSGARHTHFRQMEIEDVMRTRRFFRQRACVAL